MTLSDEEAEILLKRIQDLPEGEVNLPTSIAFELLAYKAGKAKVPEMRTFESGAIRDNDRSKIDPEGFLSPLALEVYFAYMHKHRSLENGEWRASDNWQLGFPQEVAMKSMWRHFFEAWGAHRAGLDRWEPEKPGDSASMEDSLCALIFNAFALLHKRLGDAKMKEAQECPTYACTCWEWVQAQEALSDGPEKVWPDGDRLPG